MKNIGKDKDVDLEQYLDHGAVFYSNKDRHNFRLAFDAVVQDSLGLAVIGANEVVLTYYSRMLISRLRKVSAFKMEIFPPTNTDALLRRFNQLLAQMTMDQSRQKPPAGMPVTLMVVNDANLVEQDQWTLLLQLLSDFPGVNVRLVVFFNKTTWPDYESLLTPLGRDVHHWFIGAPSIVEAKTLLLAAQATEYEREVALLLNDAGHEAEVTEARIQREPEQSKQLDQKIRNIVESQNMPEGHELEPKGEGKRYKLGKRRHSIRTLIALIVVGATAFGFSPSVVEKDKVPLISIKSGSESEEVKSETFAQTIPLIGEGKNVLAPVRVDPAVIQDASLKQKQQTVASNGGQKEEFLPEQDLLMTLRLPADQDDTGQKKEMPSDLNDSVPHKTKRLKSLVEGAFFVQHIVLNSDQSIMDYINRYPAISEAKTLLINTGNKKTYGVISGPFSMREEAVTFAKGPGIPKDFWLWEAEELRRWCQRKQACDL